MARPDKIMHRGYIKLWRKVTDSKIYRNHKLWALWTWLLLNATHKEIEVYAGLEKVKLLPGQIITGRKALAKELSVSEQNIRTCLQLLKKHGNLTIKPTNKFSIITIVNWTLYQPDDFKVTSNSTSIQPASNQQVTTKQEHKNVKNIRITYSIDFLTFWNAYPKKIGKGAACNAFKKALKNGELKDMLNAIETHKKTDQWKREGGKYIPNPATWLNQRRWEDECTITVKDPWEDL